MELGIQPRNDPIVIIEYKSWQGNEGEFPALMAERGGSIDAMRHATGACCATKPSQKGFAQAEPTQSHPSKP